MTSAGVGERIRDPGGTRRWELVVATIAALAFAAALHPLLAAAHLFGRYLPSHDIAHDYLVAIVWGCVLGVSIFAWPVTMRQRCILALAWAAKLFVALGFMLYYEWSYPTLDAFGYFRASLQPVFDWSSMGLGRGTENLEAFAWVHARVLPRSYHAMKLTCAMIGLVAVLVFHRAAVVAAGRERDWLLALLAFFPSILFWSTIFGKDPIILLGVAVYCYGVVCWQRRQAARYLLLAALGALLATYIRLWFGPILLGPLFLLALIGMRGPVRRIGFSVIGALLLWGAVVRFQEQFAMATLSELLSAANQWSQGWAEGGSAQLLAGEFSSIGGMIRFLPLGMFTALFRPLPGEVNNLFGMLAGLEDALLLTLVALGLLRTRLAELKDPLVVWAVALIVTWASLYAFVSFQNLGTAVRFKLQILPVLLLLSLHLARRRSPATAPVLSR